MKHRIKVNRLGRDAAHRWSMLRTMVTQLIRHQRLRTTLPRAKELRRVADQMVTLGKKGDLSARRRATAVIRGDEEVRELFTTLAERYREREGGYTRVLKTFRRKNDAAPMAYIEFVDRPGEFRPARPPSLLPPIARQASG
uniref:Large ribosomal subunit protein bL17c n=1 Tax=Tetraselmis sp. GSL018 TaxID=582737 RepID=A0A061QYJ2_9CHLO